MRLQGPAITMAGLGRLKSSSTHTLGPRSPLAASSAILMIHSGQRGSGGSASEVMPAADPHAQVSSTAYTVNSPVNTSSAPTLIATDTVCLLSHISVTRAATIGRPR